MKTFKWIFLLCLAPFISACDDNKTDTTEPEPEEKGSVRIATDWTDRSPSAEVPASYNIILGTQSIKDLKGQTNTIEDLEPGKYPLLIFNTASSVTVTDKTAAVAKTDGKLDPMPEWFFSYSREIDVRTDAETEINAYMQQQIRQLIVRVEVTGGGVERLRSLSGELSGVADRLNLATGNEIGNESVSLAFEIENEKFASEVRLLGIGTAGEQVLTLTMVSDTDETEVITTDLTEKLASFNNSKIRPLTLNAEIYIPAEGEFTGLISDWDVVEEGDITAE